MCSCCCACVGLSVRKLQTSLRRSGLITVRASNASYVKVMLQQHQSFSFFQLRTKLFKVFDQLLLQFGNESQLGKNERLGSKIPRV